MTMKTGMLRLAIVAVFAIGAVAATARSTEVTLKGYLLDKMCSAKTMASTDPTANAKDHKTECAVSCADGGYGVVADGKYYTFDAKGNKLAAAILKNTKKTDSLSVEVTGTVDGTRINVSSLKETE